MNVPKLLCISHRIYSLKVLTFKCRSYGKVDTKQAESFHVAKFAEQATVWGYFEEELERK